MSKKMCFRKAYCPGKIPKCNRRFHCPSNTNSKCEIITKKPKIVRVKAWACWSDGGMFLGAYHSKRGVYDLPCTILIDAKWLKEGK